MERRQNRLSPRALRVLAFLLTQPKSRAFTAEIGEFVYAKERQKRSRSYGWNKPRTLKARGVLKTLESHDYVTRVGRTPDGVYWALTTKGVYFAMWGRKR